MRPRLAALVLLLAGCAPAPAELTISLVEPATANAQYFHGNCRAGFTVRVEVRVQETARIALGLSRFSYRITDRGAGTLLADESLDERAIEERYGRTSEIPAGGTRILPAALTRSHDVGGISEAPVGPLAIAGEIQGVDENGEGLTSCENRSPTGQ